MVLFVGSFCWFHNVREEGVFFCVVRLFLFFGWSVYCVCVWEVRILFVFIVVAVGAGGPPVGPAVEHAI